MVDKISENFFNQMFPRKVNPKSLISRFQSTKFTILALIILNLCITVPLAIKLNIWLDEAYSLNTTGQNLGYAIRQSLHFELQPPLYFISLTLWRSLNHSIFWARLFSIICISLTILCVASLAKLFLRQIHSGWIVAAVAFNPFVIWAAIEVRLYAFLMLLSVLMILAFYKGYLVEKTSNKAQYFYVLFSTFALYTQYYSAFLLVANGLVLLSIKQWNSVRRYLISMVWIGLGFTPMLFFVVNQVSEHTKDAKGPDSLREYFSFISWRVLEYIFGENSTITTNPGLKLFGCIVFLVVITFILKNNYHFIQKEHIAIWIVTGTLLTIFLLARIVIGGGDLLVIRHTTVLFIPLILSIFSALSLVQGRARLKFLLIWLLLSLFFNFQALYITYKPMAKIGDYARVSAYLMNHEKPNQPILFFDNARVSCLETYYSGINKIVPLPKAPNWSKFDVLDSVINDETEILTALSNLSGHYHSVWLVNFTLPNNTCGAMNVNFNCRILEEFVHKYYSVENDKEFIGSRVRFLRQKQEFPKLNKKINHEENEANSQSIPRPR